MKKPYFAWIFAVLMILAPAGNLAFNLYFQLHSSWYSPLTWMDYWPHVSWIDKIWLSLTPLAGLLLFRQRRSSWQLALGLLALILALNLFRVLGAGSAIPLPVQAWTPILLISVLAPLLLFWLRYPYVERREGLFSSTHPRFTVQLAATLRSRGGSQASQEVTVISLSQNGARLQGVLPSTAGESEWDLIIPALDLQMLALRARQESGTDLSVRWQKRIKNLPELLQKASSLSTT